MKLDHKLSSSLEPAPPADVIIEPPPAKGLAEPMPLAEEPATKSKWSDEFDIGFDGYLRVEAATFLPDRFFGFVTSSDYKRDSQPQVGRNDGFALADARLNLRATFQDNLYVRLGFDGALAAYANDDDPVGVLSTGLKDAYMRYTFMPQVNVYVGRFKPPYDAEELTSTEDQFFVHRSLESRGEPRHANAHADLLGQADNVGFAPGRQLGVMIGSDAVADIGVGKLGYALAMTNGNSGDATLNDNDLPAFWLRLFTSINPEEGPADDEEGPSTIDMRNGGLVGLSAFYNELTTGIAPNRYRDRVFGAGFDAAYSLSMFHFRGQILAQMLQPVSRDDIPTVFSVGGHAQLALQVLDTGFFPAYRFAYLDPRFVSDDEFADTSPDADRVMHHTLGVSYRAETMPLVFWVEYTRSLEQAGRAQPNDRVEAAMQVTFR
jgi:hypothetical protein